MKYPIGIQSFAKIIENGYVYVDKTKLIYNLVSDAGKTHYNFFPLKYPVYILYLT